MKRLENSWGQTTLESIAPLLLLLTLLIAFALLIPNATPMNLMAFVGAFVIFVLTFISTQIALYILIFSMLLSPEVMIGSTEGGTLGRGITLRVDDFILVVIGFSWLARMAINKELGLFLRTPLNKPIAYYIVVCMISTFIGAIFDRVDLKTGLLYVLKYFEYIIVYFMVVNHLKDSKQAHSFLVAMLLTCAIVSVIGIAKIPTGGRISAPFEGEVGEPNTFGGYLVFMICIVMGLLQTANSFRNQLIYGFLLLLYGIPLFYTQSRSSYLAAVPAVLSFVWLSKKKQWIIPLVLLLGLTLPFIAPRIAKERVAYTFTQGVNRKDCGGTLRCETGYLIVRQAFGLAGGGTRLAEAPHIGIRRHRLSFCRCPVRENDQRNGIPRVLLLHAPSLDHFQKCPTGGRKDRGPLSPRAGDRILGRIHRPALSCLRSEYLHHREDHGAFLVPGRHSDDAGRHREGAL